MIQTECLINVKQVMDDGMGEHVSENIFLFKKEEKRQRIWLVETSHDVSFSLSTNRAQFVSCDLRDESIVTREERSGTANRLQRSALCVMWHSCWHHHHHHGPVNPQPESALLYEWGRWGWPHWDEDRMEACGWPERHHLHRFSSSRLLSLSEVASTQQHNLFYL